MRIFAAIIMSLTGLSLSACSTLGTDNKPDKTSEISSKTLGLSAQDLSVGECGVFLWAETKPRQFVFFQKQDAPTAQFYSDGNTQTLSTSDATSYLADSTAIALDYQNTGGDTVKIKGEFAGEIEGGSRITPATIQVKSNNGWQQIIPVSGVYMCR